MQYSLDFKCGFLLVDISHIVPFLSLLAKLTIIPRSLFVSVTASVAAMKHLDQKQHREQRVYISYASISQITIERRAGTMEGHCLLICSSWLAQPSYRTQNHSPRRIPPTMVWVN